MATLTIADLDNGKRDLQTVDAVANSPQDFTTTRYGDSVLTRAGALRRLGYEAPVPYASGLNVDTGLFTVSRDGVIYAPDPSLVPFTTGAWDAAQWRPVQNTANTNQVYQFPTLGAAEAAALTLPNGSAVVVEGVSQGHVIAGSYSVVSGVPSGTVRGYAELRAYSGPATIIDLTDDGIFGRFHVVLSGSENGGTLIVGADGRKWKREFEGVINVRWFGANGDGVADDTAAIQSAIGYAIALPSVGRIIFFPAGTYRITSPLNFTGGTGNTPITIQGEGWSYDGVQGGTVILGQTGGWMCDCTGVQWLSFESIVLKGTGPNASGGGVLLARAANGVAYDHGIYMRHVTIDIDSKPGFSVVGSVALANNDAEIGLYEHCWFRADTPMTLTYNNELGYVSPYQTIGWPLSSTDNKFISCQFQATRYQAVMIFGCGNVDFDMCYWGVSDINTRQVNHAVLMRPGINPNSTKYHNHGIRFNGQCESFDAFLSIEDEKLYGCHVDVMMPTPKQPYIYIAQQSELFDCNFKVQHFPDPNQNGGTSTGYAVVHAVGGPSAMYGGSIDLYHGSPSDSVSANTNLVLFGTAIRGHAVSVADVSSTISTTSTYRASGADGEFIVGLKNLVANGPTPTGTAGQIGIGTTTASSATAGGNGAVPAAVAGYLVIDLSGSKVKVPYFNT